MADVIEALNRKRASLNGQKQEIDAEIANVDQAIKTWNDAVKDYLCKICVGKGTVRIADAAGQMEDCRCPACKGSGIQPQGTEGGA